MYHKVFRTITQMYGISKEKGIHGRARYIVIRGSPERLSTLTTSILGAKSVAKSNSHFKLCLLRIHYNITIFS